MPRRRLIPDEKAKALACRLVEEAHRDDVTIHAVYLIPDRGLVVVPVLIAEEPARVLFRHDMSSENSDGAVQQARRFVTEDLPRRKLFDLHGVGAFSGGERSLPPSRPVVHYKHACHSGFNFNTAGNTARVGRRSPIRHIRLALRGSAPKGRR